MSDPYLGEIKLISFNFPPKGWAFCNGQQLPITQNQALFAILGTQYGGNGQTTFALPNLQGRVPLHQGSGYAVGQAGGEAAHTLTVAEMPLHVHGVTARGVAGTPTASPVNARWTNNGAAMYAATADSTMSASAILPAGGNQPHPNEAPYLVLNFVIALTGVFPSRS